MRVDAWFEFWIANLIHSEGVWRASPPKSASSYRTIPLTNRAYDVLKSCCEERHTRKESELLSQILEYVDRRTGQTRYLCMQDLVFVNYRTGEPNKNSFGIMPKVLQRLLGHLSSKTTMDRYVHVTDASLTNAVKQFEQSTT